MRMQVHIRSVEMLRHIQEHFSAEAKELAAGDEAATRERRRALRRVLGKTLTAVLHKLEHQANVVRALGSEHCACLTALGRISLCIVHDA